MKISCQCVTYARTTPWLEEAVQCFLDQEFKDAELVILNTYPMQTISFEHPRVRIVNLMDRPRSLGVARNMCIDECQGEWIVIWDDDNHPLPNHLSNFVLHMSEDQHWLRMNRMFTTERNQIEAVTGAEQNLIAYRKDAWAKAGKYPDQVVGEDLVFNTRLTELPGTVIPTEDHEISYAYGWGNGVYHASGSGDTGTAHKRIADNAAALAMAGKIKQGRIVLQPQIRSGIPNQALTFFKHA